MARPIKRDVVRDMCAEIRQYGKLPGEKWEPAYTIMLGRPINRPDCPKRLRHRYGPSSDREREVVREAIREGLDNFRRMHRHADAEVVDRVYARAFKQSKPPYYVDINKAEWRALSRVLRWEAFTLPRGSKERDAAMLGGPTYRLVHHRRYTFVGRANDMPIVE